ncbi:MAG TPA: crosslink repair DNA glycosylase YcaQ family protein [Actinomycetes bacterium]
MDGRFEDRVFRAAGWISPVVLVDGTVTGVWAHERSGGRVEVTVSPWRPLTAVHKRQLGGDADRLGSFLGVPATVSYEASPAA